MKKYILIATVLLVLVPAACSNKSNDQMPFNKDEVLKVSVYKSGEIRANGKVVSLQELDGLFAENARKDGCIWYYREAPAEKEPPPQAMEVMELVIKHKRPISLSSKPDFSDIIDEKGRSRPRKQ